ncbi:hypothetical protein OED01_02920 [Microbacterium sp. M28]|nr:hypothetical protein [Microbacterium sp. M28]UYO97688.1 hypothetical protein OED01_02920 [Microbacterium sp. M28]
MLTGAHDRATLSDAGADAVLDDVSGVLPALVARGLLAAPVLVG